MVSSSASALALLSTSAKAFYFYRHQLYMSFCSTASTIFCSAFYFPSLNFDFLIIFLFGLWLSFLFRLLAGLLVGLLLSWHQILISIQRHCIPTPCFFTVRNKNSNHKPVRSNVRLMTARTLCSLLRYMTTICSFVCLMRAVFSPMKA